VGKKAESIMAPDAQRAFPLKSASVMDVSIVTGLESLESPLNVNAVNDLKSDGKHREGRFCQTNAEHFISGITAGISDGRFKVTNHTAHKPICDVLSQRLCLGHLELILGDIQTH
jgi:hypothetical protein